MYADIGLIKSVFKAMNLNHIRDIELKGSLLGKKLYVIPSENFDLPIDTGVDVNLCASGGCVYYIVLDDGETLEILHEANYYRYVKEEGSECPVLYFEATSENAVIKA